MTSDLNGAAEVMKSASTKVPWSRRKVPANLSVALASSERVSVPAPVFTKVAVSS